MRRMSLRGQASTVDIHKNCPPPIYEEDRVHLPRILRVRELIAECPASPVVELGCGTGDNCGPFAKEREVIGYDCSIAGIEQGRRRFPTGSFFEADIEQLQPFVSGVIVMSEVLEHIDDPTGLCAKWLPLAEYSVISHPISEPIDSSLGAGQHLWSIDLCDHTRFFEVGGHEILHTEEMQLGFMRIILSRGRRK